MKPFVFQLAFLVTLPVSLLQGQEVKADVLFASRIQPLFKAKCLACHGEDPEKIKGDLDMRTRAGLLKGGESEEPSIVPGKPLQSPLYLAVTREHEDDWEAMPPKEIKPKALMPKPPANAQATQAQAAPKGVRGRGPAVVAAQGQAEA